MSAFQGLVDALTATLKTVDAAIPRSDPVLQRYLALKQAAWETRVASGNVAVRVQASLVAGTSWSLPETVAAAEERAELMTAWRRTTEAAIVGGVVRRHAGDQLGPLFPQRPVLGSDHDVPGDGDACTRTADVAGDARLPGRLP